MRSPAHQDDPHDIAPRTPAWRRYMSLWGPRVTDDVDDELRFHIEMRVADYTARGMSEAEALRIARARLGDLDRARRDCLAIGHQRNRRMLRTQFIDAFRQDVTFAIRSLGRRKGWTPIVVLTLALGIGANTAVFSIIDHVLLRPVSYPAPERIVFPGMEMKSQNLTFNAEGPVVDAWRRDAKTLDGVVQISPREVIYSLPGEAPVVLRLAAVSWTFPSFAGERPMLGRSFVEADGASGAPLVVALSEELWRRRFGGNRGIVGNQMTLDGRLHTIVGVFPSRLRVPSRMQASTDVWTALSPTGPYGGGESIARLAPGVSASAATQELDAILLRVEGDEAKVFRTRLQGLTEMVSFRDSLWMFAGAVALVLLMACGNVAHMLLARGTARERELAVRRALGAGRGRILRLLVTETLVLALLGCAAGVFVAWAGLKFLLAIRPPSLIDISGVSLDGRALAVAIGLSVVTGIAFGLFASVHALRRPAQESLKASGIAATGTRRQNRMRGLLIVSEIAVSAVLLVGAAMLLRTVWSLQRADPGVDPRGVYAMRLTLPLSRYERAGVGRFYDELVDRARRIPGITDATVAAASPPGMTIIFGAIEPESRPFATRPKSAPIPVNYVRTEYFRALGMRFVEGGAFADTSEAVGEIVINAAAARVLWPGESAVGRRFRTSAKGQWKRVTGVVADEASAGFGEPVKPMLYIPEYAPVPAALIIRAAPGAEPVAHLRRLLMSMDPLLSAAAVSPLDADLAKLIARQQFTMMLLVVFTTIAVFLSAIGLYGVMSYAVAQRSREIGVRVALGATQRQIASGVVGTGLRWTLVGLAVGTVGAWWATRFIEKMLFGVTPTDAVSFGAGAAVLIAIAVAACLVPARRAASVDPLIAMRVE
jgi:predicted permease